jgi:isochorismate synthase
MDIVFSDTAVTRTPPDSVWDSQALVETLQQAHTRAVSSGSDSIASFLQPVDCVGAYNPLSIFRIFQDLELGETFFWSRSVERRALVGVGSALVIQTQGAINIMAAAQTWRALQPCIITGKAINLTDLPTPRCVGPVLFGGFAFDPLHVRTELWQAFPDGLLILPRILFHCDELGTAFTLNVVVHPETDIQLLAAELVSIAQTITSSWLQEASTTQAPEQQSEHQIEIDDLPAAETWKRIVANAVQQIHQGCYEKVALARAVRVIDRQQPFMVVDVLQRLSGSYPGAYVFALQRGEHYFVGATPERLICGSDGQIQTMALAGSAPRGVSELEDETLGQALLLCEKNRGEHRLVIDAIRTSLSRICSRVRVADEARLLKLKNIQHLETPITGNLLPGYSILDAIKDLHPTPAVGGYPRDLALAAIRQHEQLDRGWYAGPIGWIGAGGSGEFAVALRSGLLTGNSVTLFAGCGIVADSDPDSEYEESCLKLQVMFQSLKHA